VLVEISVLFNDLVFFGNSCKKFCSLWRRCRVRCYWRQGHDGFGAKPSIQNQQKGCAGKDRRWKPTETKFGRGLASTGAEMLQIVARSGVGFGASAKLVAF
jgi:hypothetical protein